MSKGVAFSWCSCTYIHLVCKVSYSNSGIEIWWLLDANLSGDFIETWLHFQTYNLCSFSEIGKWGQEGSRWGQEPGRKAVICKVNQSQGWVEIKWQLGCACTAQNPGLETEDPGQWLSGRVWGKNILGRSDPRVVTVGFRWTFCPQENH